ncbi:MAG TPA: succinyldiaminopimelate transaminase [Gammaproteobacteria bacterium]|nr:succinyldiaminopimelate transaminase [Gammaproteobacteria bacterium]
MMNRHLEKLFPYPFERLNVLLNKIEPESKAPLVIWSVGEPKHSAPDFLVELMQDTDFIKSGFGSYPPTKGLPELRTAISSYLHSRYQLSEAPDADHQVLPVNGTREALFSFAQTIIDPGGDSITIMPNPFYQIYEGAALLAGSQPWYLNNHPESGLPDFKSVPAEVWQQCQLLYICSPANPSGAVADRHTLQFVIEKSQEFNFVIASDECYSEIYADENKPPPGLLEVADKMGHKNYKNCVAFNSLSKRSNLPGLRSGYISGDSELIERFLLYRTYHGSAMPVHHQLISSAAWQDQKHVKTNREDYRQKFSAVTEILRSVWPVQAPAGAFYLWPETPVDDQLFATRMLQYTNTKVLPGTFLSRDTKFGNPGKNRIRIALVATKAECIEAAERIVTAWPKLVSN